MFRIIKRVSAAFLAAICFIQPALAAITVNLDGNPGTTVGAVNADITGVTATYQYTIYDGQIVNDTIPVQLCMTGSSSSLWTSIDVAFGSAAGSLPGVTAPANQTFYMSTTPDCRNLNIGISSGVLHLANPNVSQNFSANFSLSSINPNPATGPNKPQAAFNGVKNIHILVTVLPAVKNVSCFLTDSEGNFLTDCTGQPVTVSGSSDGRFVIIANRRQIEVATNPGQFYYNLIWLNTTGATQPVSVNFTRTGVIPHGTQAIHAAVFNSYLNPLNPADFALANANGIPEGHDDLVEGIAVPAGSSLLVTYHLEWIDIGNTVPPACAGSCETANQQVTVEGSVSGSGITTESCTTSAYGYKKP